ncbi:MAG: PQQ-dependent sugar dehydrogenase, partial [Bacteroidota bacterium]
MGFTQFKKSRILLFILLISVSAFTPLLMPPPGLNTPEAIGAFLNGNFPSSLPTGAVKLDPAYPNLTFNSPLTWATHPNDNKVFVGQRDGKVFYFTDDENVTTKTSFIDLSTEVGVVWDGGFLGFTFHPNFGKAGAVGRNYFFVYYSTPDINNRNDRPTPQLCPQDALFDGAYLVLQRYEVNEGTLTVDLSKTIDMFKVRLYNSTHRGGGMVFGTDGFLYLTTGDQAQHSTSQEMSTNLDGGVLRLDVDMDPLKSHAPTYVMPKDLPRAPDETSGNGYFIPNDNPFVGTANIFEEYYTLGHRNPHRMTMDRLTGIMYIGEIGSNKHEEINVVKKGANYGWPVWEGPQAHNRCTNQLYPGTTHELPLTAFPRSVANSITGGYVYRGSDIPSLYGQYICGDYGSADEIWSVDINTGAYTQLTTSNNPISFGEDKDGELYVLRAGNNVQLQKLVLDGGTFNPPATLSQTGAFSDLSNLTPAPGVIPYGMYESFWSDGAFKKRWLAMPNDGSHNTAEEQIEYTENGEWIFPEGAVLIKHFELPIDESNPGLTKRLETRFSIVSNSGKIYGLSYKWRADGSDADLLSSSLDENITVNTPAGPRTQTWHYPSRTECLSCHNDAVGGTLGLRTRYLNNNLNYPKTGINANQLVTLSALGIIPESITDANVGTLPSNASQSDANADLEKRARSYLDLNCGYCHRPGTGNRAVFDARINTPLFLSNLFTDQLNQSLGIAGEKVIAPGDVGRSVLYQRLHSTDPAIMMPPLAKGEIDEAGSALIAQWIGQLDPETTENCQPTNVSLRKTATQSSTYNSNSYNFDANNALDGNTTGDDAANTITHTNNELHAWWEVDLGAVYSLSGINLWNRVDCCSDRLSNFYVISSPLPFSSQNLNATLAQSGVTSTLFSGTAGVETFVDINADARYIRVQLVGTGILTIAEAEVMGCAPQGEGLTANYFNDIDLTTPAFERIDPEVNFSWGTGAPMSTMGNDNYSIRWSGFVEAPTSGSYTFTTNTDDGVRLWVNGKLLIDFWINQAPTDRIGSIDLLAGEKAPIVMEYYEATGAASAQLSWQGPGIVKAVIPSSNLSPAPRAECEAFSNLAVGKSVQQSSLFGSFVPENAIDGNLNTYNHTQDEANAWWEIDLGSVQYIDHINLYNRAGCCQDRLSDYHVLLSDEAFNSQDLTASLNQAGVGDFHDPAYTNGLRRIPVSRTARYVRVQLSGSNFLHLGDIEIMGCAVDQEADLNCPPIDFAAYEIQSYGGNQDFGQAEIQTGSKAIRLVNNAWKFIDFEYTLTSNSFLEFDFRSDVLGEYAAIGMDNDNGWSPDKAFKLYGTQNVGNDIDNYENYTPNGYQHYRIPIGQFYTGAMDRLFLIMDHDASPGNGDAYFRNISIYEDADGDGNCDSKRSFRMKAILEGPYDASAGLMDDFYRTDGDLPTTDPYGLNTSLDPNILIATNQDAIVDW